MLDFTAVMARAQNRLRGRRSRLRGRHHHTSGRDNGKRPSRVFECRLISQRMREALASRRRRVRLGRPHTMPESVRRRIERERNAGKSLPAIAPLRDSCATISLRNGAKFMRLYDNSFGSTMRNSAQPCGSASVSKTRGCRFESCRP